MDRSEGPKNTSISRYYRNRESKIPYTEYLAAMLEEGFLCDVNLMVGSTVVPAHRVILASGSNYFKKLFDKPLTNNTVDMSEIVDDAEFLNLIIKYIYQREITLVHRYIPKLLFILSRIDIRYLKKHCAQFLFGELRPVNLLQIWELAWFNNLRELAAVCLIFCREMVCNKLLQCNYIKYLSKEFIEHFIDLEDIRKGVSSSTVILFIINWMSYDTYNRLSGAKRMVKDILQKKPLHATEFDVLQTYFNEYDDKDYKVIVSESFTSILLESIVNKPDTRNPESCVVNEENPVESVNPEVNDIFGDDQAEAADIKDSSSQELNFRLDYVAPQRYRLRDGVQVLTLKKHWIGDTSAEDSLTETSCIAKHCVPSQPDVISSSKPLAKNWSIIVQESRNQTASFFCQYTEKWYTCNVTKSLKKAFGFLADEIVCKQEPSGLLLYNHALDTSIVLESPFPFLNEDDEHVPCLGMSQTAFFTYSGSLYSACAVKHRTKKALKIIVNEWDRDRNVWDCKTYMFPKTNYGTVISVSLVAKTSAGSKVYIMAHVTLYKHRFYLKPCFSEVPDTSNATSDTNVTIKPNEVFYVFEIEMKSLACKEVGCRFSEPLQLDQLPTIIQDDRIFFIKDSYEILDANFLLAFTSRSMFPMNVLILDLTTNSWASVSLIISLPPFYDVPIKTLKGKGYYEIDISFFKNFMILGLHGGPRILQIVLFDIVTSEIILLSPVPLPLIGKVFLYPVDNHQPLSRITEDYNKEIDMSSYQYKDWRLKSWCGTIVPSLTINPSETVSTNVPQDQQ